MSQRLHIGKTRNPSHYDCVLESEAGARGKLLTEWLMARDGFYAGPWKIVVGDVDLFRELEPIIADVLKPVGRYPDCLSEVFVGGALLRQPTRVRLNRLLAGKSVDAQD